MKEHDCSMCVYGKNLATFYGYPYYEYISGCLKKFLWFYIKQNPRKCNNFIQKGGIRL